MLTGIIMNQQEEYKFIYYNDSSTNWKKIF